MDEFPNDWKQAVLEDFREWLAALPAEAPAAEEGAVGCDLHDLFVELAALRQEIRLQNREQGKAVRELEKVGESYEMVIARLGRQEEELAGLDKRLQRTAERRALLPFLEVRDALVRGWKAAVRLRTRRRLFRPPPPGLEGVEEGYELAIRRFDQALAQLRVEVMQTVGRPFDPQRMKAVGTCQVDQAEEGVVVEELVSGFVQDGVILRPAEVVVNRCLKIQE